MGGATQGVNIGVLVKVGSIILLSGKTQKSQITLSEAQ